MHDYSCAFIEITGNQYSSCTNAVEINSNTNMHVEINSNT